MDDRNFDEQSAADWVCQIEGDGGQFRRSGLYPKVGNWLRECGTRRLLDLGAGQGDLFLYLKEGALDYQGLDASPYLLKRAQDIHTESPARFILGDIYSIPFGEAVFDGVVSLSVFHLLEDLDRACQEMGRVLQASGNFFVSLANPEVRDLWLERYEKIQTHDDKIIGQYKNNSGILNTDIFFLRSYDRVKRVFEQFDLKIESCEKFGHWMLLAGKKK